MKLLTALSVLLLLAGALATAVPVDLAIEVTGGNQSFEPDRTVSETTLPTDTYRFTGTASAAIGLAEGLRFVGEYERSTLFGNLARFAFRHDDQFVSVSAGTFFGVANSDAVLLKPGVHTRIRFDIAGVLYAEFLSERTLRVETRSPGDYVQDSLDLAGGFYLPNAIFTLRYRSGSVEQASDTGATIDSSTEYVGEVDVYAKNVPYRVLLDFGYRTVSKSFDGTRHTMGLLILGTAVEVEIGDSITYRAAVDSSVYTFGRDQLLGEFANEQYVFRATLGATFSLGSW